MEPAKPRTRHVELRIFFSLVCLLVVVARAVHPTWFDDALDYVPIGLAALPWLGFFVTEVKLPGGIEAKLAALHEQVQVAEQKAEAAKQEAAATKVEARLMAVSPDTPPTPPPPTKTATVSPEQDPLPQQYNTIRATQPSGASRTAAMSGVLRAMVAAAASDPGTHYATRAASPDEGLRLSAAAWAVAHPDRAEPGPLVDALHNSAQPFVHYWLLMALDRIAERQGRAAFPAALSERLRAFRPYAASGADRTWLLDSILRRLGLA